jgi:N-acetylglucosamine kinase-like BadF-type ATPase
MYSWVAGFDCGGTSTRAIIAARDGRVLGVGEAGPGNYLVVGVERAVEAVRAALGAAMARAACHDLLCAGAAVAMAGAGASVDPALMAALRAVLPADTIVLDGDIVAALHGAFPYGGGVIVIAGTGSVAFGEAANGERVQVGGWGHVLGDEGSGYALGLAGLRAILEAYDGRGAPTALSAALLGHLQLTSPASLVRRVYAERMTRDEIAALAPIVAARAADGDAVAVRIVEDAGGALARLAITGVERVGAGSTVAGIAPLGGLFGHVPLLLDVFRAQVARRLPTVSVVVPRFDACGGAAILALREAGIDVDEPLLTRLRDTLAGA